MTIKAEELINRTVVSVFREKLEHGVHRDIVALELDNGTILYALADAEGNGAGALYHDDARTQSSNLVV